MFQRSGAIFAMRALLSASVAFSAPLPVYAGISAMRPAAGRGDPTELLWQVQSVDPGGDNTPDPDPEPDPGPDPDTGGNNGGNNTGANEGRSGLDRPDRLLTGNDRLDSRQVVQDLISIRRECGRYDEVYRIDCLRQGIEMTLARMPDRPENRQAKSILRRASRQLASIVSTYADRNAPALKAPRTANPRFRARRTYRAIKRSALPKAMARARAVVDEAATQLLRSAENSERRYAHYQQISAALDSTKVLLRSG